MKSRSGTQREAVREGVGEWRMETERSHALPGFVRAAPKRKGTCGRVPDKERGNDLERDTEKHFSELLCKVAVRSVFSGFIKDTQERAVPPRSCSYLSF